MTLSISPFEQPHQVIFDKLVQSMPDTSFILKAPIIIPYSDSEPHTFTITANVGDLITVRVNGKERTVLIATSERMTVKLLMDQGRNLINVKTVLEVFEISVAATNYATLNMAWAEQFFNEAWVRIEEHYLQLNSRFSLKQIEHQLVWQDLLPNTRAMRILAGKMAIKSLVNMGGSEEGVLDIAKALTGNTPIVLPTLLDMDLYEPEARLLYSSAHDFGGNEFNIWLLNLCATSWQAFILLLNNLDDDIFKLLEVSDQRVVTEDSAGEIEVHAFDFQTSDCSVNNLLTKFVDCFNICRIFVNMTLENKITVCVYQYPLDLAIELPIGMNHFDISPLDGGGFFDSCDDSDPFCDGLLGIPISCRFDQGNFWDSLNPLPLDGLVHDPSGFCMFFEPCASMVGTTLTTPIPAHIASDLFVKLEITV